MRKLSSLLMIALLVIVAISCKKDSDESNTDKLTGKWWIVTGMTISPAVNVGGVPITDMWPQYPSCVKDDVQRFEKDGTYIYDEGATKCSVDDPQIINGTWVFNADETVVSVTTTGISGTETNIYTIVTLDSDKIVATFTSLEDYGDGPQTYTYTVTMIPE